MRCSMTVGRRYCSQPLDVFDPFAGAVPLPTALLGAALIPPRHLNVMQTEINRVLAASKDGSIVPISISVPRRQHLDSHGDLFPAVRATGKSVRNHVNICNLTNPDRTSIVVSRLAVRNRFSRRYRPDYSSRRHQESSQEAAAKVIGKHSERSSHFYS